MLFEAARQPVECAREIADLISFLRAVESAAQAAAAIGDLARFLSQLSQRLYDRRAHHEREDHCSDDRFEDTSGSQAARFDVAADRIVVGRRSQRQ